MDMLSERSFACKISATEEKGLDLKLLTPENTIQKLNIILQSSILR